MKKFLAEFIGTYALVFAGTGAVIINQQTNGTITHVGIAITFGLVVMSMIYTFGNVSGAHLNPAVSIGFAAAGKLSASDLPLYILAQVAGAICASYTLRFLFPTNGLLGATMPSGSEMQSFVLELILTFFLMLVIIKVALGDQGMLAGVAIGGILALQIMFAGPICGGSMNPARSLGPAIASWHFEHPWIYLVAPVLGALGAVPVYGILISNKLKKAV